VTGALAPARDIIAGAGVGSLDVENLTTLDFTDLFLGAEQGHGAAQTTCVQNRGDSQTIGGNFHVTHFVLLSKYLVKNSFIHEKKTT
jgi:hypothetical protein